VSAQPPGAWCPPPRKHPSSSKVNGETTGEGKKEAIGQQVDLTADLGWSVLQLREGRQLKGMAEKLGLIEDDDMIAQEMKMKTQFSHHVGTGSLAGPENA